HFIHVTFFVNLFGQIGPVQIDRKSLSRSERKLDPRAVQFVFELGANGRSLFGEEFAQKWDRIRKVKQIDVDSAVFNFALPWIAWCRRQLLRRSRLPRAPRSTGLRNARRGRAA